MSAYDTVVSALREAGLKVAENSAGARSQCPSHGSHGLTLSIRHPKMDGDPVRLTCFASCDAKDVLGAVGLRLKDLYPPQDRRDWTPSKPRRQPTPFEERIPDPEHLCHRAAREQALEATPAYWEMRAEQLATGLPRPGDFPGRNPSPNRVEALNAAILACKQKAALLRGGTDG